MFMPRTLARWAEHAAQFYCGVVDDIRRGRLRSRVRAQFERLRQFISSLWSKAAEIDPVGRQGENIAVEAIERLGYRVLHRNYRNRAGELDIIAVDESTLVFIEVKTRRSNVAGTPEEAITARKRRQISRAAAMFLNSVTVSAKHTRFDVIAVELSDVDHPVVRHITNAFDDVSVDPKNVRWRR